MSNFDMAKDWGIGMARLAKNGGLVVLGLIGSELNARETRLLFAEINKAIPVRLISTEVGVALTMERL